MSQKIRTTVEGVHGADKVTNSCKLINCDGRWSIVLYWVFISGHWQDMFPLTVEGEFRTLQASERQRHLSNLHQ